MSKVNLIIVFFFVAFGNASDDLKIKDVCKWYHEEILGWHQSYLLFKKRHIEVSDKSKYPDTDDKTIQKYFKPPKAKRRRKRWNLFRNNWLWQELYHAILNTLVNEE